MRPIIINNVLHSARILGDAAEKLRRYSVEGTELNRDKLQEYVGRSLMLITAGVMEYATGGGYHQALWFRVAFLLLLLLGFLQGRTRSALRKADRARSLTSGTLLQVQRSSLTMCAVIGVIVVLMELKPG